MFNFSPAVFGSILGILIGLYIYLSFAYMTIGKKAGLENSGLAWIPLVGPSLIVFFISGMPSWPWLFLVAQFIPLVGSLLGFGFTAFNVIWTWKAFEKINVPSWWAILTLLPLVNFVIIGMAAWKE